MSNGDLIVKCLGLASCRTIRAGESLEYKRKLLLIYIIKPTEASGAWDGTNVKQ